MPGTTGICGCINTVYINPAGDLIFNIHNQIINAGHVVGPTGADGGDGGGGSSGGNYTMPPPGSTGAVGASAFVSFYTISNFAGLTGPNVLFDGTVKKIDLQPDRKYNNGLDVAFDAANDEFQVTTSGRYKLSWDIGSYNAWTFFAPMLAADPAAIVVYVNGVTTGIGYILKARHGGFRSRYDCTLDLKTGDKVSLWQRGQLTINPPSVNLDELAVSLEFLSF
jgi:hypothetical protein